MSAHLKIGSKADSQELSPQEQVALAAANWVKMGIPVRVLKNDKETKDPRTPQERKDPVATYFALKRCNEELNLALITGPETGILALDAYTNKPGIGMEALETLGFYCSCGQADALIRNESKIDGNSAGRFHTVLYYAGRDQFLEASLDQIPGVYVRKSGEKILLPPSKLRMLEGENVVHHVRYELEGTIAPAGIRYLPDELRKVIRNSEYQQLSLRKQKQRKSRVREELYDIITEGKRNVELTRRAGYLIGQKKLSLNDALQALLDINRRCCIPPLEPKEIRNIVRSISKRHLRHG